MPILGVGPSNLYLVFKLRLNKIAIIQWNIHKFGASDDALSVTTASASSSVTSTSVLSDSEEGG